MTWVPELITEGEIDALRLVAAQAWSDDTEYPLIQKRGGIGEGQCYITTVWLQSRLGGFVGKSEGHFAWMSPDKSYILDLTNNHTGSYSYLPNENYVEYKIVENERTRRFAKRANLLFNNLSKVVKIAADGQVGDALPGQEPQRQNDNDDQYWHDEPKLDPREGEYKFFMADGELEIAPSKDHSHDDLKKHLSLEDDYEGPMAAGHVIVNDNTATWEVASNVDLRSISKQLQEYSKNVGWHWGGLTDIHGEPIDSSFGPDKKAKVLNYVWADDHLFIGKVAHSVLALNTDSDQPLVGAIQIVDNKAKVLPVYTAALESLFEWAGDQGFRLYGSSNNLIKRYEDMEQKNLGNPDGEGHNPVEGDGPEPDEKEIKEKAADGVILCPDCEALFPTNLDFQKHRREDHGISHLKKKKNDDGMAHEINQGENGKFPKLPNMDLTNPNRLTEQQPSTMPVTGHAEASRVDGFDKYVKDDQSRFYVSYLNGSPVGYGAVSEDGEIRAIHSAINDDRIKHSILDKIERHNSYLHSSLSQDWKGRGWVNTLGHKWVRTAAKEPKDLLEASVPFVYDIPADSLTIGTPGQKTSDIPGNFAPGGIVEGEYAKGGKVTIFTMTNMPYSVNHLLSLWYNDNPTYLIKSVFLEDDDGGKTKLASR